MASRLGTLRQQHRWQQVAILDYIVASLIFVIFQDSLECLGYPHKVTLVPLNCHIRPHQAQPLSITRMQPLSQVLVHLHAHQRLVPNQSDPHDSLGVALPAIQTLNLLFLLLTLPLVLLLRSLRVSGSEIHSRVPHVVLPFPFDALKLDVGVQAGFKVPVPGADEAVLDDGVPVGGGLCPAA